MDFRKIGFIYMDEFLTIIKLYEYVICKKNQLN